MDDEWLTDDEQRAWRAYVRASSQVIRMLDRALKVHGLSNEDYGILAMLSEAPEQQLRLGELAEQLRVPKPFLTYRFQRLEAAGLVERRQCPSDARGAFVALTDAGTTAVQEAAPSHVASVRRALLDHLDVRQVHELGELMTAVIDGLDRSPNACPGDDTDGC